MIKPGEIQKMATALKVRDQQIEKDYILSWILQGVAQESHLSKCFEVKGGTVLQKVYSEGYRFSEDLDPKNFFTKLEQCKASYKGHWKQSMVHQINDLPDFDKVVREVQRHIKNLTF